MKTIVFILSEFPVETSSDKIVVGRIQYNDPQCREVVFKIQYGNTGSYFVIGPCSGILSVKTSVYNSFVRSRTWSLNIRCTDELGSYIQQTWKVVLTKDAQGNPLPIAPPVVV